MAATALSLLISPASPPPVQGLVKLVIDTSPEVYLVALLVCGCVGVTLCALALTRHRPAQRWSRAVVTFLLVVGLLANLLVAAAPVVIRAVWGG